MTSAAPLLHLHPVVPQYQMKTSSVSSCAHRPSGWTSSASPCLLPQGTAVNTTELSRTGCTGLSLITAVNVWTVINSCKGNLSWHISHYGQFKALLALYVVAADTLWVDCICITNSVVSGTFFKTFLLLLSVHDFHSVSFDTQLLHICIYCTLDYDFHFCLPT